MEKLHTACSLLYKGNYMMKLNLEDVYYAVPIHPGSRKYLSFQLKGAAYEFCSHLFLWSFLMVGHTHEDVDQV